MALRKHLCISSPLSHGEEGSADGMEARNSSGAKGLNVNIEFVVYSRGILCTDAPQYSPRKERNRIPGVIEERT